MIALGTPQPPSPVVVDAVDHFFGEGDSHSQVLFKNSLRIEAGELVIMTGPSGSGKTTLLTLIGALRSVQSGRIEVLGHSLSGLQGRDLVAIRRNIGFIFQMHNLFDSLSAFENVKMAMQLSDCPASEMRRRGTEVLERLGLGHRIDHKPRMLSGGQRQRVAVARALVNRPKLILADEPTAALDKDSSRTVVDLLKELSRGGSTVMMVTHDNRILELADRIINMVDGTIKSNVVLRDAVRICEFLRTVNLFKHLTPIEITNIAEKMTSRRYQKGEIIIREGEPGEEFFLIGLGSVDVHKRIEAGEERQVATLSAGGFFGESALIANQPRNATCAAASEHVEVFSLGKADFKQALKTSASFKDQIQSIYFQRQ